MFYRKLKKTLSSLLIFVLAFGPVFSGRAAADLMEADARGQQRTIEAGQVVTGPGAEAGPQDAWMDFWADDGLVLSKPEPEHRHDNDKDKEKDARRLIDQYLTAEQKKEASERIEHFLDRVSVWSMEAGGMEQAIYFESVMKELQPRIAPDAAAAQASVPAGTVSAAEKTAAIEYKEVMVLSLTAPLVSQVVEVPAPEIPSSGTEGASGDEEILPEPIVVEIGREAESVKRELVEEVLEELGRFIDREMNREAGHMEPGRPEEEQPRERIEHLIERFFRHAEEAVHETVQAIRRSFLPQQGQENGPARIRIVGPALTAEMVLASTGGQDIRALLPQAFIDELKRRQAGQTDGEEVSAMESAVPVELQNSLYFYQIRHPWLAILINRFLSDQEWRYLAGLLEQIYRKPEDRQGIAPETRNTRGEGALALLRFFPLSQVFITEKHPVLTLMQFDLLGMNEPTRPVTSADPS